MDIGLREWLIIGGLILIIMIVIDGWRRMQSGRNRLRMNIDRKLVAAHAVDEEYNPELPGGGARSVLLDSDPLYSEHNKIDDDPLFSDHRPELKPASDNIQSFSSQEEQSNSSQQQEEHPLDFGQVTVNIQSQAEQEKTIEEETASLLTDTAYDSEFQNQQPDEVQQELAPDSRVEEVALERPSTDEQQNVEVQPEQQPQTYKTSSTIQQFELIDDSSEDESELSESVSIQAVPEQKSSTLDLGKPISELMKQVAESLRATNTDAESSFPPLDLKGVEETNKMVAEEHPQAHLDFGFPDDMEEIDEIDDPFAELNLGSALDDSEIYTGLNKEDRLEQMLNSSNSQEMAADPLFVDKEQADSEFETITQIEDEEIDQPIESGKRKALTKEPAPENVLVISVVAKKSQVFNGALLKKVVSACGMLFGDMDIYHRFEQEDGKGQVQFSMANALSPGTFDPEDNDTLNTRAVMFFMSMEEPNDVMDALECMLATAETVARHLGGDILDEDRSVLRAQTMEHYRQRVRDFEMANLKRRGR